MSGDPLGSRSLSFVGAVIGKCKGSGKLYFVLQECDTAMWWPCQLKMPNAPRVSSGLLTPGSRPWQDLTLIQVARLAPAAATRISYSTPGFANMLVPYVMSGFTANKTATTHPISVDLLGPLGLPTDKRYSQ
ncbi:hypothetical protein DFP72DRAFT_852200 [Ephemerocybe angulata]|uniref:Uncharacterized protein n=1 Tax=Ephemerocybe angulata TaxID=980116 RepID=A0A8H6M1L5_9AGAR|nr:hypothetical protein DFP72DRAFT_852200 [Tulosesus angulatus]